MKHATNQVGSSTPYDGKHRRHRWLTPREHTVHYHYWLMRHPSTRLIRGTK